jgi:hypothetical protein
MKRDKKTSFCISEDLHAAAVKRFENLGVPSLSSYINGLILMDLITQPSHKLAEQFDCLGWKAKEKIIAGLAIQEGTATNPGAEGHVIDFLEDESVEALIRIAAEYKQQREAPVGRDRQQGGKAA